MMLKSGITVEKEPSMYRSLWKAMTGGFFCVVFLVLPGCQPDAQPAPGPGAFGGITLVHSARIYMGDKAFSLIENGALAISEEGTIIALGDNEAMLRDFPEARRVDLGGKFMLPGLIDSHGHLSGLALSYTRANLVGTSSKTEVMNRLHDFEATLDEEAWLLGRGWDQNDWPEQAFPTRQDLDVEFPNRPVWLERIDGHAAWGNSVALAQADRNLSGDWQPEGGAILRDSEGQASGVFIDGAMLLVDSAVPAISPGIISAALDRAVQTLNSLGLTAVHDPGIDRETLELYLEKISMGKFPIRVFAMADGMNEAMTWLCENGPVNDPSGRLVMRSVKLYGDGALGSRGAALLEDYGDDPGNRGLLFASQQQVEANMRRIMQCGLQIGFHAIGDGGNRQALDAFEKLIPDFPDNPGRHRIEHAQILHPQDIPRFAQLGIIAAMQPTHATSDMYWAEGRLGEERLSGAYAWRSLLDSGATLTFGSDFPVEEVNPMHGLYAAVTRQDMQGQPKGGWILEQAVSRNEAIRAFALDAAFAGFMEDQIGSLEVGKRADFIVIDRDIMTVPSEEIFQIVVEQTWLDGKPVYIRE
jgi:predicted amidohydrolase YtcJ